MKCTRCGAEVEAQKFCIYCGERLQGKESLSVQRRSVRAHSGVLRFRHRAAISQTSLPEVQRRQPESRMQLASLSNSQQQQSVSRRDHTAETFKDVRDRSSQSRELEALLLKLNGQDASMTEEAYDAFDEDEELYEETSLEDMDSLDVDMDEPDSLVDNSFFIGDESRDVSGPVPMGSGSFSRIPSGGFHLVIDSIKSACQGMVKRIQALGSKRESSRQTSTNNAHDKRKYAVIGIVIVALCVLGGIVWGVSQSGQAENNDLALAAQAPVGGNEDFAILALEEPEQNIEDLTFDPDDFVIPELELAETDSAEIEIPEIDAIPEVAVIPEKPAKAEKAPKTEKTVAAAQNTAVVAENRTYGRKDNVMATVLKGESYKVSRSCIMREGPASRFGLVKQIPSGAKIQILTGTEEDWVLQSGGVWTKTGETPKLGPGKQFADAPKGAKLPQPKSRVISASNWKYIQFGDVYGYVGPACFK